MFYQHISKRDGVIYKAIESISNLGPNYSHIIRHSIGLRHGHAHRCATMVLQLSVASDKNLGLAGRSPFLCGSAVGGRLLWMFKGLDYIELEDYCGRSKGGLHSICYLHHGSD